MLDYIYISKLKPLKSKALRGNPKPLRFKPESPLICHTADTRISRRLFRQPTSLEDCLHPITLHSNSASGLHAGSFWSMNQIFC